MKEPTRVKFNMEKAEKEFSNPSKHFKPKEGKKYWYIDLDALDLLWSSIWHDSKEVFVHRRRLLMNNVFKTQKQAQEKLKIIKAILKK